MQKERQPKKWKEAGWSQSNICHTLFHQNTLYFIRTHFIHQKKTLLYQNTLYFIRSHFISSKHILFTRPETILFHQNTLYFIKTHFIHRKTLYFIRTHFILSEHSLFHQNTFYSPYHVLITKCMLTKCTSHFSHQNPLESANVTLNTKKGG